MNFSTVAENEITQFFTRPPGESVLFRVGKLITCQFQVALAAGIVVSKNNNIKILDFGKVTTITLETTVIEKAIANYSIHLGAIHLFARFRPRPVVNN